MTKTGRKREKRLKPAVRHGGGVIMMWVTFPAAEAGSKLAHQQNYDLQEAEREKKQAAGTS